MELDQTVTGFEQTALTIPTQAVESDGTLRWSSTSMIVLEARSADAVGLGYSYCSPAATGLVDGVLAEIVVGARVTDVARTWQRMVAAVRNLGRPGVAACAISAIDMALWDLKARCLGLPLCDLLGRVRDQVVVYGSGGFTSLSETDLQNQLAGWVERGISMVKMKVGRDPDLDQRRVAAGRRAIGDATQLFVDANGAYSAKQAVRLGQRFAEEGVTWFEEPVSSEDLRGLRLVRQQVSLDVTAGEYAWGYLEPRRMLEAGAVDVLQADVTRCLGITGLLKIDALCSAFDTPLSLHTAPTVHAVVGAALPSVIHVELFADHERIEKELFEGFRAPVRGVIAGFDEPGIGVRFRRADAERYATW